MKAGAVGGGVQLKSRMLKQARGVVHSPGILGRGRRGGQMAFQGRLTVRPWVGGVEAEVRQKATQPDTDAHSLP